MSGAGAGAGAGAGGGSGDDDECSIWSVPGLRNKGLPAATDEIPTVDDATADTDGRGEPRTVGIFGVRFVKNRPLLPLAHKW